MPIGNQNLVTAAASSNKNGNNKKPPLIIMEITASAHPEVIKTIRNIVDPKHSVDVELGTPKPSTLKP